MQNIFKNNSTIYLKKKKKKVQYVCLTWKSLNSLKHNKMQACVWKLKCEFHWLDCEYKFIKLETVYSVFIGWIGLIELDFED